MLENWLNPYLETSHLHPSNFHDFSQPQKGRRRRRREKIFQKVVVGLEEEEDSLAQGGPFPSTLVAHRQRLAWRYFPAIRSKKVNMTNMKKEKIYFLQSVFSCTVFPVKGFFRVFRLFETEAPPTSRKGISVSNKLGNSRGVPLLPGFFWHFFWWVVVVASTARQRNRQTGKKEKGRLRFRWWVQNIYPNPNRWGSKK